MKTSQLFLAALATTTVATALAISGGAAFADPPIKLPPNGVIVIDIAAEETPCGAFTVTANDQSKGRIFTRPDGTELLHFAGPISGVVTSVNSGRSITVDFSGPVWVTPTQLVLTGASLIWNPGVFELVRGRVVAPNDQAVNWSTTGSRTDLCAALGA